ncbi:MAG: ADP-glyceromanno-heptose 6-epimerase [Chlamydiales bacterium]|nr:ADP-glyceromanno-heptose 6-epimerase [Chlamydiales bacterium]
MDEDKRIVLTGGAGFIGSAVLRHLNNRGFTNIVVVDNLGMKEKWKNLVGKQFVDIIHKDNLFSWLVGKEQEIEAFIHLGACSSTTEFDANYLLENNYRYTQRLCEYALENNHRFIYASSAATYGDGSRGFSDDQNQLENLRALNMYGYSKHLFDLWAKREGVLGRIVGLKYFNIYGPNEAHKGSMASAIVKMVPKALEEGVIQLFKYRPSSAEPDRYPDGEQCRDFLYVKDCARMTCAFLERKDVNGIFNIGQGHPYTWNYLAKTVFNALNLPVNIEYIDMPEELIGKYQNYTCAEMDKYEKAFPEYQVMPLEDAVFDYVRSYIIPEKRW